MAQSAKKDLRENRYRRFTGKEDKLLAYWPLAESPYHELRDMAVRFDSSSNRLPANDGILGDASYSAQPRWVRRDLILCTAAKRPHLPKAFILMARKTFSPQRMFRG